MTIEYSEFGKRLCCGSGIEELMDDLGNALSEGGGDVKMLGGGQPAHIPEMNALWQQRMEEICASEDELIAMLANYQPPKGNPAFISALSTMFREQLDWQIDDQQIAITSGGQSAFFSLFNSLAGRQTDGSNKKILLPLVPEYIGYANQSVGNDMFQAITPLIEKIGADQFKYRVDFDSITITDDIAAICVSRPTNPTGNVLTDNEMLQLSSIAKEHNIPLIIDNAYGAPFPNIFFANAKPLWDEHIILTMSLSKIGLPGTRTGIVIANETIISGISSMNAIAGLANNNVGQAITLPLIQSGKLMHLSESIVQPFYQKKSLQAQAWVRDAFSSEVPFRMHLSEGALFLWLWFEDLPVTSSELYELLKEQGVLIVSGHYFFFGMGEHQEDWKHQQECIRMTFTMTPEVVQSGIQIIAKVVKTLYKNQKMRSAMQTNILKG